MNILLYFCLDLSELKNCKTEMRINSHLKSFENIYFFDEFKPLLNDYIKTIKNLALWEHCLKNYRLVDLLNKFQNIKVCFVL